MSRWNALFAPMSLDVRWQLPPVHRDHFSTQRRKSCDRQSQDCASSALKDDFGETMSRGNIHLILKNDFYIGSFRWAGETLSRHATSANCNTSGDPYCARTIAFIECSSGVLPPHRAAL